MSQRSTHFLFNIQAFSPLKLWLSKTTPRPIPPSLRKKRKERKTFSLPVKTIFLFNPTGSQRGRQKREWASCMLIAQWFHPPPPPLTITQLCLEKKSEGRGEKGKSNHKQRNPHISHIIPAGESSCGPEFPWWSKHSRCAEQHRQISRGDR